MKQVYCNDHPVMWVPADRDDWTLDIFKRRETEGPTLNMLSYLVGQLVKAAMSGGGFGPLKQRSRCLLPANALLSGRWTSDVGVEHKSWEARLDAPTEWIQKMCDNNNEISPDKV